MFGIHPDLRRHVLTVTISGSVFGIVGVACVFVAGSGLIDVFAGGGKAAGASRWVVLAFGALMVGLAYASLVVTPRWCRWATNVLEKVHPVEMQVVLRRKDWSEPDWYVELSPSGSTPQLPRLKRLRILPPRWDAEPFVDHPLAAKVYLDPESKTPVVIRTHNGLVWVMASRRAASVSGSPPSGAASNTR